MNFVLQTPSLQHLAGIKVVIGLWNEREILTQVARTLGPPDFKVQAKKWVRVKVKMIAKVSALPLPEQRKKQLINLIKPIGMEVLTWCECHTVNKYLFVKDLIPNNRLCWTMHGTIEYKKTAELMVKDARLSIDSRYALACLSCFEDEARELFRSMGEKRKQKYVRKVSRTPYGLQENHMIAYFTYTFYGDADGLNNYFQNFCESIDNCLFRVGLVNGDRAMCDYFFPKLSQRDNKQIFDEHLRQTFHPNVYNARTMLYYFSMINEDRQSRMLERCTAFVLQFLLAWPMQSLFMETARREWPVLCRYGDPSVVLEAILWKIMCGFEEYDYTQMFWECWALNPAESQRRLNSDCFVASLLRTQREEFIKLLLNEAPWYELKRLVEDRGMYDIMSEELRDESSISCAALLECKEAAALDIVNEPQDEEKRLRSKHLTRLVDIVMEKRVERRSAALRPKRKFFGANFFNIF